jgi:DnaJ-class molecular chaperone
MPKPLDPYLVLGIQRGADPTEVKRAYRRLVLLLHPDVNGDPACAERLREVQSAYEQLGAREPHRAQPGPALRHHAPAAAPLRPPPRSPSPRGRDLFVELTLTPEEAAAGLTVSLRIPAQARCEQHARQFEIVVPPGVHNGDRASTPLGPGDARLVVLVRVE